MANHIEKKGYFSPRDRSNIAEDDLKFAGKLVIFRKINCEHGTIYCAVDDEGEPIGMGWCYEDDITWLG